MLDKLREPLLCIHLCIATICASSASLYAQSVTKDKSSQQSKISQDSEVASPPSNGEKTLPRKYVNTFSLTETLSVHHPGDGEKVLLVPFTNNFDQPVIIDSYSVTCACSKNVRFPKGEIQPKQEVFFELTYSIPKVAKEALNLSFRVNGHRKSVDNFHDILIAEYAFVVPVFEPISLASWHDRLYVTGGKKSSFRVLNSTSQKFRAVVGKIPDYELLKATCVLAPKLIGSHEYQEIVIEIAGFDKYLAEKQRPERVTVNLYAAAGEQQTLESIGGITIPINWVSEIEHFPKSLSIDAETNLVEVNVIGRSMSIADFEADLVVFVDGKPIAKGDFSVTTVSKKWLRISTSPKVAMAGSTESTLTIEIPTQGWRFEVPVKLVH